MDNETWLLEEGDRIIKKEADSGLASLSPLERLIHCLWVADYGMRNAGDLATAEDLYPDFFAEGKRWADELALPETSEAFSLHVDQLEKEYFKRFDSICDEIRSVKT